MSSNTKVVIPGLLCLILITVLSLCAFGLGFVTCKALADNPQIEEPAHVEETEPEKIIETVIEPVQEVEPIVIEPVVEEPVETERISLGEFKITHYCPCSKCCGQWADGITATGTTATEGRTIAVDPKVIPYGSHVVIRYENGTERSYIAEDCGGSIKGNRIDVFMDSHEAALDEGVKMAEVYIVKE